MFGIFLRLKECILEKMDLISCIVVKVLGGLLVFILSNVLDREILIRLRNILLFILLLSFCLVVDMEDCRIDWLVNVIDIIVVFNWWVVVV